MRPWPTTTENKFFCENVVNTCCYYNIFTIVEILVSYRSNKKMLSPQHFHINFIANHRETTIDG